MPFSLMPIFASEYPWLLGACTFQRRWRRWRQRQGSQQSRLGSWPTRACTRDWGRPWRSCMATTICLRRQISRSRKCRGGQWRLGTQNRARAMEFDKETSPWSRESSQCCVRGWQWTFDCCQSLPQCFLTRDPSRWWQRAKYKFEWLQKTRDRPSIASSVSMVMRGRFKYPYREPFVLFFCAAS